MCQFSKKNCRSYFADEREPNKILFKKILKKKKKKLNQHTQSRIKNAIPEEIRLHDLLNQHKLMVIFTLVEFH
jgi:hypothetical protein